MTQEIEEQETEDQPNPLTVFLHQVAKAAAEEKLRRAQAGEEQKE